MPTPEEIEKLAIQYAEFTDLSVVDQLRVKLISKEFLTWVLRDYCLVEKSKASKLCRLTLENGNSEDFGLIDGLVDWVCDNFEEEYHNEIDNPLRQV